MNVNTNLTYKEICERASGPNWTLPDFQKYKDARHEQMNTKNLPEVKVNSDYKKWLLIGGGVLAVYWLFFRK